MQREITHWNGNVLWSGEAETIKDALHQALAANANVLTGAVLRDADLTSADLTGAVLTGADLTGAVLRDAVLTGADLTDAVLTCADLTGADLTGAVLTGAVGVTAPVIPHIDAAIVAAINGHPDVRLDMREWHCETRHCRSGWAIHLAGLPGRMLEDRIGPAAAGALIYAASRPGQKIPNFYDTREGAWADLQACAARDPLPSEAR